MDPNANLKEQLDLTRSLLIDSDRDELEKLFNTEELADAAYRLAELVEALDGWLSKKGFLPKRWER